MATGELVSAALLVMALHERGVAAIWLSGPQAGITTDGAHGRARITGVEPVRIREELEAGRVVVVAGFQGATGSEVATLGRGGSDTSAVALAITLGASRCDIYTDVDGVYTADPRLVPDARRLPQIGYEEMLELAHQGARVLQTRSVELAWVHGLVMSVGMRGRLRGDIDHGGADGGAPEGPRHSHRRSHGEADAARPGRPAGHGGRCLRASGRGRDPHRQHHPERRPRRSRRSLVHRRRGGPARAEDLLRRLLPDLARAT